MCENVWNNSYRILPSCHRGHALSLPLYPTPNTGCWFPEHVAPTNNILQDRGNQSKETEFNMRKKKQQKPTQQKPTQASKATLKPIKKKRLG